LASGSTLQHVPRSRDVTFGRATLYLDDLRAIEAIAGQAGEVSWKMGDYQAKRIVDLAEVEVEPEALELELDKTVGLPRLGVRFTSYSIATSWGVDQTDLPLLGVVSAIREVIASRQTWRDRVSFRWSTLAEGLAIGVVAGGVYVAWDLALRPRASAGALAIAVTVTLIFLLCGRWAIFGDGIRRSARVILVTRNERPSLWARNRERIVLELSVAVVGAVIGSMLTYLLTRPSP